MAEDQVRKDQDEEPGAPSKSALKREMTALQALGETLCELSPRELERIPIASDDLKAAIEEASRIKHHSALRRHRQYIGKLMRQIDPEPIQTALTALHEERRASARAFQALEELRDELLRDGDKALGVALQRFPHADRQQLRQLCRQASREQAAGKPPAASRRLFRYLRDLQQSA